MLFADSRQVEIWLLEPVVVCHIREEDCRMLALQGPPGLPHSPLALWDKGQQLRRPILRVPWAAVHVAVGVALVGDVVEREGKVKEGYGGFA